MTRARWLVPTLYIVFLLLPIYWLVSMSFKTTNEILGSFTLWPNEFTLDNYIKMAVQLGYEVDFDFFFLIEAEPIGHLLAEASGISVTRRCESRTWEHTYPIFLKFLDRYGTLKMVASDKEGCVAGDEAGVWLARNGIKRRIVGRAQHLQRLLPTKQR